MSVGCANVPANPSFPTNLQTASFDLNRMEASHHALHRPLVIVGGMLDPGISSTFLQYRFSNWTGDDRVISVELFECLSVEECSEKIIRAVEDRFPSAVADETVPVDVIGYSLGGVASRYASLPSAHRRLNIARLFTISSPMRGALAAERLPIMHPLQRELRPGSDVVKALNANKPAYPIYSYIRLGDYVVGAENGSLDGTLAWWVPDAPFTVPHGGAFFDPRILADIARRLRDEAPLARLPASALPDAGA
jgi:hypothetical protein